MNDRKDLPPEGCHQCGAPVAENPIPGSEIQQAVTVDTGMAYVVKCPGCAGPDRDWSQLDLEPEYDPAPVDLNACCRCNGTGGVQVEWNYWTGAVYDPCTDCDGTGRIVPSAGAA